jgi:hypothetical protein
MNKNKHIFGNNISIRDKTRVNSTRVHFSITRHHPKVSKSRAQK